MTLRIRHQVHQGSHATLSNARAEWTERRSVLLEVTDGVTTGFGEAAPLPGHSPESLEDVLMELESLRLDGAAETAPGLGEAAPWLAALSGLPNTPSARFAVETALLDFWGRRLGLPLWRFLAREPVAQSLPASSVLDPLADDLDARVEQALAAGYRTAKLKIGRRPLDEATAIARLRRRYDPSELRLRLDANRAWSNAEAQQYVEQFAALGVDLVEEPSREPWPAADARGLPWALDESLVGVVPSQSFLAEHRPGALVLKPMLLGGFERCLTWAALARAQNVPVIVSHFFDGPIGLAATTQLAFAAQSVGLAAGLGPHAALRAWDGVCPEPEYVTAHALVLPGRAGHGVVPHAFSARDDALLSVLAAATEEPERVALCLEEGAVTFGELAQLVKRRLAELEASGASEVARRSGRPIALVARLSREALGWLYACLEARLPILPLHPRLSDLERQELIERTRPVAVIEHDAGPRLLRDVSPAAAQGSKDDSSFDLAWLMTSGSTGAPKAVRLSRRAFLASARASEENLGWLDEDRWLLGIPWAHIGGLSVIIRCLVARRTVVVDRKLAAEAWSRFLDERRVTLLSLVPTQLTRLLENADFRFPASVRAVLLGGAPATVTLLRTAAERGVPVLPTYGLTETCAQVATARYEDLRRGSTTSLGQVGPSLRGVELRIDAEGAIGVRGPTLLSGYADQPSPLSEDGWLTTSDWGELTEGGLTVRGRLDSIILTGGENVAAEAVEAQLLEHPAIASVCVVGVPDAEWGELVTAVVELRKDASGASALGLDAVSAWAQTRLSGIVRPKAWLERESLPLLPSGKADRISIAREARDAIARSRFSN